MSGAVLLVAAMGFLSLASIIRAKSMFITRLGFALFTWIGEWAAVILAGYLALDGIRALAT
jgi:hypothetical protein